MSVRIAVVTASKGTLLGHCFSTDVFKKNVHCVITDRECGAESVAREYGVDVERIEEVDNLDFSNSVLEYCRQNSIDYIVSIFPRLFVGALLDEYANRIFNIHPALLPAFPGLSSFDVAVDYGVRFIGETVHVVDEGVDTGPIVIQCSFPLNPDKKKEVRHSLFTAEAKMLIQLVEWLDQGRICIDGRHVSISEVEFNSPYFSPALDSLEAIELSIQMPS